MTERKDQAQKSLIALLAVVAILVIGGTVAWFTFNATETVDVETARIQFDVTNSTVTATNMLPGEEIPNATVAITNTSTRAAFMRVKLDRVTEAELPGAFYHETDMPEDIFAITGDLTDTTKWVKIGDWYYHVGPIASSVTNIPLISAVTILTTVGNEYQERVTGFRVTIDAIQGTQAAAESLWVGTGNDRITSTQATTTLGLW